MSQFQFLSQDGGPPPARTRRAGYVAMIVTILMLVFVGVAAASIVQLPPGAQVNDDLAAGIDAQQNAGVSDVVGGALTAGAINVPWATFEQKSGTSQQIFVRSFANGAWKTRGPSLNIDPAQEAEAPSIDFAGAGRTVPWVSWYEPNANLPGGETNIFASRFVSATNVWIPEGQDRAPAHKVPSLNIHTDREAENPAVAGGVDTGGAAGAAPVPWVAWQEKDGGATNATSKNQIFVSEAQKKTDCTGNAPGSGPSVNSFCWQQVGLKRLNATTGASSATGDPSLNIDPSRDGIEPDIAFTGPNDSTPWVVWYETGNSGLGLRDNEQVFAAKGVANASADGGFQWVAVGNGTAGQNNVLNTVNTHGFGNCAVSTTTEDACSLNAISTKDAEDPRVATGTLTPGGTTVPWVVWTERNAAGHDVIFVSRLVNKDHFELFNNGQPISDPAVDSSKADITFEGNVPYITWHEVHGSQQRAFSGHFEGGTFVNDTPGGLPGGTDPGLRAPISSGCTANPFTADGSSCPGGAAGTPFFLRTTSDSPKALLAHAYSADAAQTGDASAVTQSTATVAGTIATGGGPVNAHVEFGATAQYGSVTANQRLDASVLGRTLSADLSGLPAGTTIHYRVVASTDFGSVDGDDRTFTTAAAPPPPPGNGHTPPPHVVRPSISGAPLHVDRHRVVKVGLSCPKGTTRCKGTLKLVVHGHTVGVAAYSIAAGHTSTVSVHLSRSHAATLRYARKVLVEVGAKHRTVRVR